MNSCSECVCGLNEHVVCGVDMRSQGYNDDHRMLNESEGGCSMIGNVNR